MAARKALGKGLDALIPQTEEKTQPSTIPLDKISVNPEQPRARMDGKPLEELINSIKANGVLQAILVRPKAGGGYELVAGERRYRAAQFAGLREIPADVRDVPDDMMLTLALVENLLREDLDPIEEAKAYRKLADGRGLTHAQIAKAVGKSRSEITNRLRLLELPRKLRLMIINGKLSAGHARALIALDSDDEKQRFAREIVKSDLSVREIEEMIRENLDGKPETGAGKKKKPKSEKDPYIADIEKRLEDNLATKVRLAGGSETGRIVVNYYSSEDLVRILKLLGVEE
jgi:ParB family chromosome partitioning protein